MRRWRRSPAGKRRCVCGSVSCWRSWGAARASRWGFRRSAPTRGGAASAARRGQRRRPAPHGGGGRLGAYAVERCERSVRWAEAARCLARRVEELPQLRRALATAKVSWSVGELLARVATPADEARWLELAQSRTVRQMRVLVTEAVSA